MPKLTKTVVEAAAPRAKQFTVWCSELRGFGVYVLPSGQRTYFVDYRTTAGLRRRLTIGRHGVVTAEVARKLAIATLGEAVRGDDPAEERAVRRKSLTVRDLCDRYMEAARKGLILGKGGRPKKASTLYVDQGRIKQHIIPLLGGKLVCDLTQADIARFIRDVSNGKTAKVEPTLRKRGKAIVEGGRGTAARTAGLLGGMLTYAVSEGVITSNPANGVKRPADGRKSRRLTHEEYYRLGQALERGQARGEPPQSLTAIRLLALTGCRSGEILKLTWGEVDFSGQCLRLRDSKEGPSVRPIGLTVLDTFGTQAPGEPEQVVLPGVRGGAKLGGLARAWKRITKDAALTDVTPHTLRHSFASVAGDLGFTESTIAALLGHSAGTVTSRYVHHLDSVLIGAADKVSNAIVAMMTTAPATPANAGTTAARSESVRQIESVG